ncbi:MAG: polysaccharide deacetylase family protein [Pseudomonadota bacterium]
MLSGLNMTGLDRLYQQLGNELGMILTLHHVRPDPEPDFAPNAHLSIKPEFLEAVIRLLRQRGFDIVSMDEARRRIQRPDREKRFAAFTFDDGYTNTLEFAAPILQKHDVPYAVYLATGLIEGTADLWWDAIADLVRQQDYLMLATDEGSVEVDCSTLPRKYASYQYLLEHLTRNVPELEQRQRMRELCWLYNIDVDHIRTSQIMSWDQVREIASDPLCTIGAHSINHHALARLDEKQAKLEMVEGGRILEATLGRKPKHFAYPYGYPAAAASREFQLAKSARYSTAVTTRPGMIYPEHSEHLTALPRVSVNGLYQHLRYFAPLTSGLPTRMGQKMRRINVA